jgi:Protein of unknown function (DUF1469).
MQKTDLDEKQEKKETVKDTISDITDHVTDYVNTFYRLQVLNATKKATDLTANFAGALVAIVLGVFVVLFGGIALAWWLGDLLDSRAGGFALVGGFFALLALVFLLIRKNIIFPLFRNKIIRKIYE